MDHPYSPSSSDLLISEDLVPTRPPKAPGITTLDFNGLLRAPLRLYEDLADGCGGQVWPAGQVLASYLLRTKREELAHARILELGAGGGLVGLAVALGGELEHLLRITDQAPMLGLMQRNIVLNGLSQVVEASVLDWGAALDSAMPRPTVVLAADCVYFEPAFEPLIDTLGELLGEGVVCYFCFKKRRRADVRFMRAARREFLVREVGDDELKGAWGREGIYL
ncbi:MAG: hypothetical protein M1824_006065 [Vezdaea acicularis]|nr:MAG: hypothetical protein M1824_006065 [Vezdaea acicularis]